MYHQIDATPRRGTPFRSLVVSPRMFFLQLWVLRLMGYRGISMSELEPYLRGVKSGKVVGITFDDGFQNVIEYGLPVLIHFGFTSTAYVLSSDELSQNTWDLDIGVPQKRLMSNTDLRSWLDAGMEIGAHSRTHRDLTTLSQGAAYEEIAGSKRELESKVGGTVKHFCYPYGRFAAEHIEMVRSAGFSSATTVEMGRARVGDNLFHLHRVMVARTHHPLLFASKVFYGRGDPRG